MSKNLINREIMTVLTEIYVFMTVECTRGGFASSGGLESEQRLRQQSLTQI